MKLRDRVGCAFLVAAVIFATVMLNVTRTYQLPARLLLIDIEVFPAGWQVRGEGPRSVPQAPLGGRGSLQSVYLSFYLPEVADAFEEIYLFGSTREASRYYARRVEQTFGQTEWDDTWTVPEELSYQSFRADQYRFACDESTSRTPMQGCTYIAQYGVYVVLFCMSWIPDYSMSYTDLAKILQAIDERF